MTDPKASDDLVGRLRVMAQYLPDQASIYHEAASEIESLRAKLAAAEENAHDARGVADLAIKHRDDAEAQLQVARKALDWVEGWVSNPVGSYSVSALDGLFGMTRDKIAALRKDPQ